MSLFYILFIILIVAVGAYVVYKYVPDPVKTVLLWIIGIGFTLWLLDVLGLFDMLKGVKL